MRDEMLAKRVDAKYAHFHFVCPGCESGGDLSVGLIEKHKPFGCPEGCGATFVLWQHVISWRLRAVVVPVFKKEAARG
jgi:hypothetical protein